MRQVIAIARHNLKTQIVSLSSDHEHHHIFGKKNTIAGRTGRLTTSPKSKVTTRYSARSGMSGESKTTPEIPKVDLPLLGDKVGRILLFEVSEIRSPWDMRLQETGDPNRIFCKIRSGKNTLNGRAMARFREVSFNRSNSPLREIRGSTNSLDFLRRSCQRPLSEQNMCRTTLPKNKRKKFFLRNRIIEIGRAYIARTINVQEHD